MRFFATGWFLPERLSPGVAVGLLLLLLFTIEGVRDYHREGTLYIGKRVFFGNPQSIFNGLKESCIFIATESLFL